MVQKRRSRLEERFEKLLQHWDVEYEYEVTKIPYIIPESNHKYTVDWSLINGILLETKGYLSDYAERKKYILIKEQHPDLDLRFVFDNANKLCGGTKMTHGAWAIKNGFRFCDIRDTEQLEAWMKEKKPAALVK